MGKPRIDSMVLRYTRPRKPKPKAGDRKVVKGKTYEAREVHHDGCIVVNSRGQPRIEWITIPTPKTEST